VVDWFVFERATQALSLRQLAVVHRSSLPRLPVVAFGSDTEWPS
jgi:hypothetical protein